MKKIQPTPFQEELFRKRVRVPQAGTPINKRTKKMVPLGWLQTSGGDILPHKGEREAMRAMFRLHKLGYNCKHIARALNKNEEMREYARGYKWHHTTVINVLRRGVPEWL